LRPAPLLDCRGVARSGQAARRAGSSYRAACPAARLYACVATRTYLSRGAPAERLGQIVSASQDDDGQPLDLRQPPGHPLLPGGVGLEVDVARTQTPARLRLAQQPGVVHRPHLDLVVGEQAHGGAHPQRLDPAPRRFRLPAPAELSALKTIYRIATILAQRI